MCLLLTLVYGFREVGLNCHWHFKMKLIQAADIFLWQCGRQMIPMPILAYNNVILNVVLL